MKDRLDRARSLLRRFKGDAYAFGLHCLDRVGGLAAAAGRRVCLIAGGTGKVWGAPIRRKVLASLAAAGVQVAGEPIPGARPNAPRADVVRLAEAIRSRAADAVVVVGSGSTIDAAKAAAAMAALGDRHPDIEEYFGVGQVGRLLAAEGRRLPPMVAVQLAASSAAHLTRYSNITDPATSQKKLIVDDAVVPAAAAFDYAVTTTMGKSFTADGAMDGVAHCLEVFWGAAGEAMSRIGPVATLGIELIVRHVRQAVEDPEDLAAREALGLGTDLGGYAIMLGGTSGAHLTSFSLVDVLSHGRACALMNPYYTVFFAPAIGPQLRAVGAILAEAGWLKADLSRLAGRDLGVAVAEAMVALSAAVGLPTTLSQVAGFTDAHVARALAAAKNPQLEMKLKNMPVPLSAATVEQYMGPILEAARTGDLSLIRNVK